MKVGDKFTLNCGTEVSIKERVVKDLYRLVDHQGNTQVANKNSLIRNDLVWVPGCNTPKSMEFSGLERAPMGCYIYHVFYQGDIVYIGKGIGDRYRHVHSGISHCYELNRHHFLDQLVYIEIAEENVEPWRVDRLESENIEKFKPLYNRRA